MNSIQIDTDIFSTGGEGRKDSRANVWAGGLESGYMN